MADETPPKRPATPEPASDAKKHASKHVVLSSVAKPPLSEGESLLGEAPADSKNPPPLPAKSDEGLIRPVGWTTRPGGTTTIIQLPPKTGVLPRLTSLSQKGHPHPPPLPSQENAAGGDDEAKRLPPIKLQPSTLPTASESESIFSSGHEAPSSPVASHAPPPSLPATAEKKSGTQALPSTVLISKSSRSDSSDDIVHDRSQPVSLIPHAPPLVPHEASAPVSEEDSAPKSDGPLPASVESKKAELAKAMDSPLPAKKPEPISAKDLPPGDQVTQRLLPVSGSSGAAPSSSAVSSGSEIKSPVENEVKKMRLPPRADVSARLKKAPEAGNAAGPVEKSDAAVTPPKVFPLTPPTISMAGAAATPAATVRAPIKATVTPPTIPLHPATGAAKSSPVSIGPASAVAAAASAARSSGDKGAIRETAEPLSFGSREKSAPLPSTRAARMRKRRIVGIVAFYILLVVLVPCLYFAAIYFSQETRIEGQVIPPRGMLLANEVWIVTDFRDLAAGISSDLASDRMIVMQDMQEKLAHVQRAQADVAAREARIRALTDKIKAANQEELALVKQARDASQQIWDGPGAQLDTDYQTKLAALNQAIADRAKANHLQYEPDPNYFSPEVWANAYRLALYQVPAGVDPVKERLWLDQQMKNWHDFSKASDQKRDELREQAAQLKLAPTAKIADLKSQIDDLQTRIDGTTSEEEPIKAELEQAQADLTVVQQKEAGLDAKPLEKLDMLPDANITKRLPLTSQGRFSWREVEKESKYDADEKSHVYWIFARAYRIDGRQYWALLRFNLDKNTTKPIFIAPDNFVSTKSILRPDLPPDEQAR